MPNDIRHAFRRFGRDRSFTATAVLTLSLGIGANIAVFSLCRAVLLDPLPFPGADRLVTVFELRGGSRSAILPVSGHEFAAWKAGNRSFEHLALGRREQRILTGLGDPEAVIVDRVSSDYFAVTKLTPVVGRAFAPVEDTEGPAQVAVLSYGLWRRRFGADPEVVGRSVTLDDNAFTVIGVSPPLSASLTPDLWVPIDLTGELQAVGRHTLRVTARLRPDVTLEQAQADLEAISANLARELPNDNTDHHAKVVALREELVGEVRRGLLMLLGAVGGVLLIACANVANLLLASGTHRHREFAVRAALGASRLRIVRQMLAETLVLALIAGMTGLLLAAWITDLVPRVSLLSIPLLDTVKIDGIAVAFATGLSLLAGIAAGVVPALRCSRRPAVNLREGAQPTDDRTRRRLHGLFMASEVALTLVLLAAAGLMINSFLRLLAVNPGFSSESVLVVPINLPATRYADAEQRRSFVMRLVEQLGSTSGVDMAGATSNLPLGGTDNWMPFSIEGRPAAAPGQGPTAAVRVVTDGYFGALRIPLKQGRLFSEQDSRVAIPLIRWFPQQPPPSGLDRPQPVPVAVISETTARQFWPGEDPLGKRIRVLFSPEITIVGVVGDIKHNALSAPSTPHIYLAHNQEPWNSVSVLVRTSVPPLQLAPAVRHHIRALDDRLPIAIRAMDDVLAHSIGRPRFYAALTGLFSAVALALAVVGIFGVVSYVVAQRTREIGVRMALGAQYREILSLIVAESMRPIALGLLAGGAGALLITPSLSALLFELEPSDPLTLVVVLALMTVVAVVASWVPARRAARLDPVAALRAE